MKHGHALLFATLAALMSMPTLAHHGQAAYDRNARLTLTGTVTEFRFINPHAQIAFDVVTESGEIQHWMGAVTSPNKLARAGWSKSTLQPGDVIEVSGLGGRNDARSMHINQIVTADGHTMQMREQIDGRTIP
jgi:hypothetical protein